jgi:hypothetical protein
MYMYMYMYICLSISHARAVLCLIRSSDDLLNINRLMLIELLPLICALSHALLSRIDYYIPYNERVR